MTEQELKKIFKAKTACTRNGKSIPGFKLTTFEAFFDWFDEDTYNDGCYYCGISAGTSNKLYVMQRKGFRVDGTRGGKRGRRLELDRLNPFEEYDKLDNIVWCCYWCNNAKSNFFSAEEFKPIGKMIGKVIDNIIKGTEGK